MPGPRPAVQRPVADRPKPPLGARWRVLPFPSPARYNAPTPRPPRSTTGPRVRTICAETGAGNIGNRQGVPGTARCSVGSTSRTTIIRAIVVLLAIVGAIIIVVVSQMWVIHTDMRDSQSQKYLASVLERFAKANGRMPNSWNELAVLGYGAYVPSRGVFRIPIPWSHDGRKAVVRCADYRVAFGLTADDLALRGQRPPEQNEGARMVVEWLGPDWPTEGSHAWSRETSARVCQALRDTAPQRAAAESVPQERSGPQSVDSNGSQTQSTR